MGSDSNHASVAIVFFCHDGQGKFLMHKRGEQARDEQGKWDIAAGSLEFGETVEQTLRREVKEEFDADVLGYEFLGYRDDLDRSIDGNPMHWVILDFKVLIDPATAKNNEPHKFDAIDWFTFDSLPPEDEMHSQWGKYIRKYRDVLSVP